MNPDQEEIESLKQTIREQAARISDHNLLGRIKQDLLSSRTSAEACQVLARDAPVLLPGVQAALYFRTDVEQSTFERAMTWGGFSQRKRTIRHDQCRALHCMKPHHIEKQSAGGLVCPHACLAQGGSCLCLPLLTDGLAMGMLHLHGNQQSLSPWKRKMAEELGDFSAMLFGTLRLRELLSEQAIRDPLTRLFNRRHMEESLRRELAVRTQRPLGIIMIDIDHFKRYNTRFGHQGGDELLRAFGAFLQKKVRPGDVACRYGGEEFLLIMPGASLEVTENRAERMRKEVKHLVVTHRQDGRDRRLGRITLSLGVAVSGPGCQAEEVIGVAARALSQAKAEGRDRVVVGQCVAQR